MLPKLAGNDYELLTAKNPESENVQMTEAELDLVRKAWFSKPVIVSLNPKQQFTWILSTRKTPDTETLKAFGFK